MRMFAYTHERGFVISIHENLDAFRFDFSLSQGERILELDIPEDKVEYARDKYNFREGYQWFDHLKPFLK